MPIKRLYVSHFTECRCLWMRCIQKWLVLYRYTHHSKPDSSHTHSPTPFYIPLYALSRWMCVWVRGWRGYSRVAGRPAPYPRAHTHTHTYIIISLQLVSSQYGWPTVYVRRWRTSWHYGGCVHLSARGYCNGRFPKHNDDESRCEGRQNRARYIWAAQFALCACVRFCSPTPSIYHLQFNLYWMRHGRRRIMGKVNDFVSELEWILLWNCRWHTYLYSTNVK